MTARVGFCIAALSLAGVACDGGGSPKIKSFAASESNLPLTGGDVTLTWDVKGESSLELRPFPGTVHGTGITLSVTETTEFTLVAKANGRTDRETLRVGVGDAFAVAGKVLRPNYGPAAGVGVYVSGVSEPAFTDSVGNFRVEGAVAPYDLVILDPGIGNSVTVYQGLTRPDPTVVTLYASAPFTTNVSGTVTGVPFPTPTPPPTVETRVHYYMASGYRSYFVPNGATGTFNNSVAWGNSADTTAKFTSLRWVAGTDNLPESFPGFSRTTEQLQNGVSAVVNPVLAPVASTSLSGSVTPHESLTSRYVYASIDFASGPVPASGPSVAPYVDVVDLPAGTLGTANTFTRFVPNVTPAFLVTAGGYNSDGSVIHTRRAVAPGTTGISLDLPAPPLALLPVQNAVVSSGTLFSLSSDGETVNLFEFMLNGGSKYVIVLSADDSIRFPDLSAIGIVPGSVYSGTVYYRNFGPFGSMDDATGTPPFVPAGDDSYTGYANQGRNFTGPGVSSN